jgi:histidyl-tRNA synthetase
MEAYIKPRVLRGFRDSLPEEETAKGRLIAILENTFRLFGFVPIDTPVLEYSEILLGKSGGETEKQVYRFLDHGKRDVAMRYDLTVPFARFMASHHSRLYLPFKRYHIAKVWRGENTQRGRYREFIQCDFDIVGTDSTSADFEILLVMVKSIQALGIDDFRIHFSHRGTFNRLLKRLGLEEKSFEILRTVDRLKKLGLRKLKSQLEPIAGDREVDCIVNFIEPEESSEKTIEKLIGQAGGEDTDTLRLREILKLIERLDLEKYFSLDPSITRGLDYYTGLVYETYLTDQPGLGSICSGGRYNNLASLYTKEKIPGVGSSIGLDRLLTAMLEIGKLEGSENRRALLVLCLDEKYLDYYHEIACALRDEGVAVEVYPEKKKLARQFQYAEKKKFPFALICGEDEREKGTVILKDLRTRESYADLKPQDIAHQVDKLLATSQTES